MSDINKDNIKFMLSKLPTKPKDAIVINLTLGQKISELFTSFFGSWTFIGVVSIFLTIWIVLNSFILKKAFDIYPYVLLNLCLSLLATIQNPIIQMGSNLDMAKNRIHQEEEYQRSIRVEKTLNYLIDKLEENDNQNQRLLLNINSLKGYLIEVDRREKK